MKPTPEQKKTSFKNKLDKIIEKNICYNHDVAFYANQLSTHPDTLNRWAKKYLSVTIKKYLSSRILEKILEFKRRGDKLQKVANATGFMDTSYLSRFIKREAQRGWKDL